MHKFILLKDLIVNGSERTMFFQEFGEYVVKPVLKLIGLFSDARVSIDNSSWLWPDFSVNILFSNLDVDKHLLLFKLLNWFFFFYELIIFIHIVSKSSQNNSADSNFRPILFYLVH